MFITSAFNSSLPCVLNHFSPHNNPHSPYLHISYSSSLISTASLCLRAWKTTHHHVNHNIKLRSQVGCNPNERLKARTADVWGIQRLGERKILPCVRRRLSVTVLSKKDSTEHPHDHQSGHEVHVRPEIHGRKTRPGRPKPAHPLDLILFQGFNWESHSKHSWYTDLKGKVSDLASAGITDVWLPPPSQSVDKQGYLPSQLYNLDQSFYGNEAELKDLIDAFHEHGMCCIADIVINHRSGWRQDSGGHWNVFEGGTADKRLDWGPWAVVDNDIYDSGGKGHHDSGESYGAAPDLDHTSKQVQDELTDWMNWLKAEIGFDGWRFDFVKGYAPAYTKLYCQRTDPTFAVGELWTSLSYVNGRLATNQNSHRQQLCDWIDGTDARSCAFDFTTKGILQAAVQGELWRLRDEQEKPPGLIGWYPERAVTFVDNHDTGSTQRHWNFPDEKVLLGYVYILTHPGIPCVFYDHYFYWGLKVQIKHLLELRRANHINAKSKITIQAAESDIYVANIDERLIVKIGPRFEMGHLLPNLELWKLVVSGSDFAIWETTLPLPIHDAKGATHPVETPDLNISELTSSNIHLRITEGMSCETINRIIQEAPDLVENPGDNIIQSKRSCNCKNLEDPNKTT